MLRTRQRPLSPVRAAAASSSLLRGHLRGSPEYIDMMGMPWISSMSRCIADPVATVARGDRVRIHSVYDALAPTDGVMGIMIGYIDQQRAGPVWGAITPHTPAGDISYTLS